MIERKIGAAIKYGQKTQTEVAEAIGTSRSNFNQRMKRGSFKVEELEKIAEALGAKFSYSFDFEDGTKI
ncbi:MAG: helix-turn-helix transcriptional regulator [Clostridia bacterium]|nr:helix-turn-helix transcriptional regulator [Clostridia bacterium]